MAKCEGNRVVDFVTGAFFGALAGVVVGVLWAPRSGAESRHQLSEGLRDVKGKTGQCVDDTKYQTEKNMQQFKHMMENKLNLLLDAVKAGKNAAEKKYSQLHRQDSNSENISGTQQTGDN